MKRLINLVSTMSPRERWLVLGLSGGVVASLLAAYFLVMLSRIGEMEDLIADGREGFAKIEQALPRFLESRTRNDLLRKRIQDNPIKSVRLPINAIAKNVHATSSSEDGAGARRLSDVVRFSGKTRETPLVSSAKSKKKKGKKDDKSGVQNLYWIEEEMDFPGLSVDAMYEFLGRLAESEDLLFINALQVMRKSNDPNEVRVNMTVGTIRFVEPTEEE
jgi:hypothetical protein